MRISRRQFALAGTAAFGRPPLIGRPAAPTAQEVADLIQKNAGVPWQAQSLDTFKAGDPATPVTGIATTGMATMDVLTRASQQKANLVVTLEPVFFGRLDGQPDPAGRGGGRGQTVSADDPIYKAKQEFIRKNGLVVWRFSDHWRARHPDPLAVGLARALRWTGFQAKDSATRYELPPVSLGALVDDIAKKLDARAGIRVTGDPQTRVRTIGLLPGSTPLTASMSVLPGCDVVVAGETREWESVEYAQDTVASGQKKGFIMLGRLLSEEPSMNVCAEWLQTLVPQIPVHFVPAGDPYWRPA